MKNKLKRILYVGYYLYKMDRSVFWKFLNFTSIETGRSKLYLIVASINDSILFNVSLLEYFQFRFFEKNQLEKSNWAGTGFMYEYQLAMNPKNVRSILKDKILFLDTYKDFVRHDHLTLNELKKDEQKGAFLLQENTKVVLKNSKGQCGIGIVILNTSELTPYVLIQRLENTGNDIVEAFIQQHEDLEKLSPSGLNTLRLITQLNHENKVELLGARIRVTVNNSIDNMAAGNLVAEVDLKSGKISSHAVYSDITKEDQDTHPYTKTVFKGYQIPFFYEAITMVKEAALCFPQNRSIGWDVAITSTGPQLLEANHDWCRLVWQLPVKKGLKPILENHLKKIKTNKQTNMNILISGIGGPTPQSIARSLKMGKFGSNVKLFGTDSNPLSYGLYDSDLYEETRVIPYAEGVGYWDAIEEMVEKHDITYAMVHPEKEVIAWAKRQTEGKPMPCKVMIPNLSLVNNLVDKAKMSELLKGTNFIPSTLTLDPLKLNFEEILKTLTPPFWIRSSTGSCGLGSLKIHNNSELHNWISINPNVESFIASSYLPGRNLACKLLYFNGELIRSATGERVNYIMSNVAPSGITGNTSFGRLINDRNIVDVSVAALTLLSEKSNSIKHGIFTVDLKEDENGTPFLTEINVRMVAFNDCFAKAGANFSDDILQLMSDGEIDRSFINYAFKEGTIFLRNVDSTPILLNENELKLNIKSQNNCILNSPI